MVGKTLPSMDEFTCAICGETFAKAWTKAWTDEEAAAERLEVWGSPHEPDDRVVCEDCWQRMRREAGW